MVTGIGLFSGGLDSILAVKVLQQQHINVEVVCFVTPFFDAKKAQKAIEQLGIPLHVLDITEKHFEMLKSPRYGYGRNMNPCIDCHGLMFHQAGELMKKTGAHFLFSGEVLGERPMSQNKNSLRSVEKLSGFQGYIIRPLSARLLPETIPEREGLVDRSRLLAIQGRSRKPQLELVHEFGITYFPEPAGGCKLTEPAYSVRLKDLMNHSENIVRRDLELLNIGRHLRLPGRTKIIVGRDARENERLESMSMPGDIVLTIESIPGPTVLIPCGTDDDTINLAASICVRYSDVSCDTPVPVTITKDDQKKEIYASAYPQDRVRSFLV